MLDCFRRRRESDGCNALRVGGGQTLPLSAAAEGQCLKVACIQGGRLLCGRMAAMGIYPGVEMELLCAGCGLPCLVKVHGGTLSLGAGVSDKILVTSTA